MIENLINSLNAARFLKEFSFSKNDFTPNPGQEIEFADHVICIEDLLIVFQLKERKVKSNQTLLTEKKWFENKVLNISKKQIKNTIKYFQENDHIEIINQRGYKFDIKSNKINIIIKLIVYSPSRNLPRECYELKFYNSADIGFIHVLADHDYKNICNTFITPIEIAQYFNFREKILTKFPTFINEKAIVGQCISGHFDSSPDKKYVEYLESLENDVEEFDISSLLKDFKESIENQNDLKDENDYYVILQEFAKLHRADLREVKKRIVKSIEKCKSNKFSKPFRMLSTITKCGFVFIPIEKELIDQRRVALTNLTYASKYLFKIRKHIGISFVMDRGFIRIEWCIMDFDWHEDSNLKKELDNNNPFRNVQARKIESYKFR